ncbi:MAG: hypothetical protein A2V79_02400 [Betaproteobacteria bacterium RBG_16_56_24]|nr:MAG: hypothetical protein A2V79_02400 [Betaproteobacteria bacterium RBG_16_56_24]
MHKVEHTKLSILDRSKPVNANLMPMSRAFDLSAFVIMASQRACMRVGICGFAAVLLEFLAHVQQCRISV